MRENLPKSLQLMFGNEGGYSNKKSDSGGPTKFGVTHATLAAERGQPVTEADVKALTLAEAEGIYVKSYWSQSGGDVLPAGLDYASFDFGVNAGPSRAIKVLQGVLGVVVDGNAGAQTAAAARAYPGGIEKLIKDYCAARVAWYRTLKGPQGWTANGRGWERRVTGIDPKGIVKPEPGVVGNALVLARGSQLVVQPTPVSIDVIEQGSAKAAPAPKTIGTSVTANTSILQGATGVVVAGTAAAKAVNDALDPVRDAAAAAHDAATASADTISTLWSFVADPKVLLLIGAVVALGAVVTWWRRHQMLKTEGV